MSDAPSMGAFCFRVRCLLVESPSERMERVLSEESAYDAFDGEMAPDAHRLHHAVRALAAPDAVPYLASVVDGDLPGKKWAVHALGMLGPAGSAAADALERAGEWVALFRVDEARARAGASTCGRTRRAIHRGTRSVR